MEMKINSEKVIHERKLRAWSQQHLADASVVSLRTIQRVENNGSGSLDTVKALASCFELDVNELFKIEIESTQSKPKPKIAVACSFILALFGSSLLLTSSSMASNFVIRAENVQSSSSNDYHVYSKNVEIFLPNDVTFELLIDSKWETETPSIAHGSVKIHLENSIIYIDKASITRVEHGTKITANYAKMAKSE
ncbi:helix-turn-helix transcriptional regulator [Pseudoalteromonas sp. SG45-5]|jgi:transcriptional regulator with XRE-family HTH domain|uniref:helix-turn-helix transcriptional regulator n=1 Tax=unclassified Pseudoalteromonas TaxID=194690 RepID=UPI0015FAE667|nr:MULTISPECIES: helix-turn-helix transcriptional regulator [unclassified Pseudoalteromonas]MBB1386352.1 helix-turn-helix transcriptional regulator [Pseudoalteromonas sp. SG45-5]MBB1394272.1 helix-turn-helix transcriptional regulator [Pseudoalteromonas sp. SG44-4]MBB1447212.1 helix-turn-helix transcriptional regulator [Pseudoalteromonas sp. SG41-6]